MYPGGGDGGKQNRDRKRKRERQHETATTKIQTTHQRTNANRMEYASDLQVLLFIRTCISSRDFGAVVRQINIYIESVTFSFSFDK